MGAKYIYRRKFGITSFMLALVIIGLNVVVITGYNYSLEYNTGIEIIKTNSAIVSSMVDTYSPE